MSVKNAHSGHTDCGPCFSQRLNVSAKLFLKEKKITKMAFHQTGSISSCSGPAQGGQLNGF